MSHKEQRDFIQKVRSIYKDFFTNKKVLEVGSLNVNGTIRDFFNNCEYTGIDVGKGDGVDIVCSGQDYNAPDKSFDVVCSAECFEHNPYWFETFKNMIRICKDDGLVFFTCASTGRAEHGTTRTDVGSSPHTSEWNYYKNLEENDFTSKLDFKNIFNDYYFEYNPHSYDLYFWGIKRKKTMKKIVDYFPFFNEKELLELRLNLLNDYVDEFIISELNYTHSGNPKDFICKNLIDELGFSDKVKVLELEIDDSDLIPNDIDTYSSQESKSSKEVLAWTRERLQRDALLKIINEYEDDVVFISSDCDEIINPQYLKYFSDVCRSNLQNIIKVPLVLLEGRADKRLFENNNPVSWSNSLLLCTSVQLKNGGTPTQMRSNVMNQYSPVWITENGEQLQDCGWHFTWMGDEKRRQEKAKSFIHYANLNSINTLSNNSFEKILSNQKDGYNDVLNSQFKYETRNYPTDLLPKVIFKLPRVKNFLLPIEENENLKQKIKTIYSQFDNQYGVWGWCPQMKSDLIIDCVMEVCKNQDNPVCVEIGVYGGKSLFPFGLALKELGKGIVYGIDPWLNEEALVGYDHPAHQEFWGNINLEYMYNICLSGIDNLKINDYVSILRTTSDNAKEIRNISVLHIDGQHTDQIIRDINKYATNVIDGGYCFLDDVEWSDETIKSIPLIESLGFEKVCDIFGCMLYKRKTTENILKFGYSLNSKPTAWIVDNFYENPDEVRKFALEQEYVEGGFGRGFIGRRTTQQFLFPGLKERFEEIIGKKITAWQEHGMNGRFQVAWSGEPLVYHCDSQTYGGMIYLTPNAPYQCGTTLYAHKKTGARTYYEEGYDASWTNVPGGCHLDGTHFEPVDVLGNVYNRLAIFDGSAIHSASEYFGTVKENARLWQMFFFCTD